MEPSVAAEFDDGSDPDLHKIGIVGMINLGILACIIIWRLVVFLWLAIGNPLRARFKKRLLLHVALLLSVLCDLPMYYGFIYYNEYVLNAYAFHKFECALLFVAYSITVSDWSSVLFDIKEFIQFTFVFQRGTLYLLNAVVMGISIANFIYIFLCNDLEEYLTSKIYVAAMIIQISSSLLLTGCFLQAGLKLSWRIGGVLGKSSESNKYSRSTASPRLSSPLMARSPTPRSRGRAESAISAGGRGGNFSSEFQAALRTLNLVTGVCTASIFIQALMLSLNYLLGYSSSTGAYVGPVYFYWTFYSWFPLWGPVISLLYLQRASTFRKKPDTLATKPGNSEQVAAANEAAQVGTETDETHPLVARNGFLGSVVDSDYESSLDPRNSLGTSGDLLDSLHQSSAAGIAFDYSPRATEDLEGSFDVMHSPSSSANSFHQGDMFYRDVYGASILSSASNYIVGESQETLLTDCNR